MNIMREQWEQHTSSSQMPAADVHTLNSFPSSFTSSSSSSSVQDNLLPLFHHKLTTQVMPVIRLHCDVTCLPVDVTISLHRVDPGTVAPSRDLIHTNPAGPAAAGSSISMTK
jgi:hypothetical protein